MLSETETDQQNMINVVYTWCKKWRMRVNIDKSKVMHFRTQGNDQTNSTFKFGDTDVDIVETYKYLGIVLNYSLNFEVTAGFLAKSGGRALGAIYNKFRSNKGLSCKTYTKMFETGVVPILDYCSGVWGNGQLSKIDTIQNRAIHYFLGTHKFTPNLAINGDMGWVPSRVRRKVEMLRLWNRLVNMADGRLTKRIFLWDKKIKGNWSKDIETVLRAAHMENKFVSNSRVDLTCLRKILFDNVCSEWKQDVKDVSKLRTYITFKEEYKSEPYLFNVMNRQHRSLLAQLRCGTLPLKIETGRFQNIPVEFRLCIFCSSNVIENETHFLLHCLLYNDIRTEFFNNVCNFITGFDSLNDTEKVNMMMSENCVKMTAEFVWKCFDLRQHNLYVIT